MLCKQMVIATFETNFAAHTETADTDRIMAAAIIILSIFLIFMLYPPLLQHNIPLGDVFENN